MEVVKQPQIQLSFGESVPGIEKIDEDLIIFESISNILLSDYPVRVDIALLALCNEGRVRTMINLKELEMTPGSMLVAMPDQILQQLERSDDFSGIFIGVSRKLINEVILGMSDMLDTFLFIQEHPLTKLKEEEILLINQYYTFLLNRIRNKTHRYHKKLTHHLLSSLFYETFNIVFNHHKCTTASKSRQEDIFERFLHLVHAQFVMHRTVVYYADELNISPKYLSQTIKAVSGKTAGEWIDLYVILEAKVLLRSSADNIQAISDRLNFPNQSFFGKYFKQHVGLSPKDYRKTRG